MCCSQCTKSNCNYEHKLAVITFLGTKQKVFTNFFHILQSGVTMLNNIVDNIEQYVNWHTKHCSVLFSTALSSCTFFVYILKSLSISAFSPENYRVFAHFQLCGSPSGKVLIAEVYSLICFYRHNVKQVL